MDAMDGVQIDRVAEVGQLTEEYARYATSKSGIGNVLGGLTGIAIYLINGFVGRSIWTTVLTLGLTIIWLVGKEILRATLYQSFGTVQALPTTETKKLLRWSIGISLITALGLWIFSWVAFLNSSIEPLRLLLALICATSMPLICWRFFHTLDEFMVGFFLLLCCAITSLGGALDFVNVEIWLGTLWVPLYSLILIGRGIREHLAFRQLANRLQIRNEIH